MLGDDRWTAPDGTVHIIRPSTSPALTVCRQLAEGDPARARIGCDACVLTAAVELENQRLEQIRTRLVQEREAALSEGP